MAGCLDRIGALVYAAPARPNGSQRARQSLPEESVEGYMRAQAALNLREKRCTESEQASEQGRGRAMGMLYIYTPVLTRSSLAQPCFEADTGF